MTSSIFIEKQLMVGMRDGVALATDVYRPATEEPVPVLLQRTPYDKEISAFRNFTLELLHVVQAGYAVVVQDTRGRFASEGTFDPFHDDARDGLDTIRWIQTQDWSTGQVGMFGASYYGATQWLAAAEAGDGVGAMAPVVTWASYPQGWVYQDGALQVGLVLHWLLGFLALGESLRRLRTGHGDPAQLGALISALDDPAWFERLPDEGQALLADLAPYFADWLAHQSDSDYWTSRSAVPYAAITAPALIIGGWYDLFLSGTLSSYRGMRENGGSPTGRRPRLLIGPWAHGNMSGCFPERSFGFAAAYPATDPTALHLRWFDRHLRGLDNGLDEEPPVRIFVMGADEWRDAEDWPLPGTTFSRFYLHSSGHANNPEGRGTLTTDAPADEPADVFRYDPADPVPTVGGATFLPGLVVSANAGPRDQSPLDTRVDVLTYLTEPLEEDLEVIGPVTLVLFVSSSAVDTDFTGKLVDVGPDGRSTILTDGILRARYRDSMFDPALLQPGEVYELHIDLVATANVFRRSHRIRLDVSSSNFPRFDRNPNTGSNGQSGETQDLVVATNRVHHDSACPSHLVLPIINRS